MLTSVVLCITRIVSPAKPCKYYGNLGYCPKGEECTFIHDTTFTAPHLKSIPISPSHPMFRSRECKFHLAGHCHQDEACTFLHTGPAGQGEAFEDTSLPHSFGYEGLRRDDSHGERPFQTRPCKWFALGKCVRGDNCNFSHDLPDLHSRRPTTCMFFKGPGTCRNNDQCPYFHSTDRSFLSKSSGRSEAQDIDFSNASLADTPPIQLEGRGVVSDDEDEGEGDVYDSEEEDVIVMTIPGDQTIY